MQIWDLSDIVLLFCFFLCTLQFLVTDFLDSRRFVWSQADQTLLLWSLKTKCNLEQRKKLCRDSVSLHRGPWKSPTLRSDLLWAPLFSIVISLQVNKTMSPWTCMYQHEPTVVSYLNVCFLVTDQFNRQHFKMNFIGSFSINLMLVQIFFSTQNKFT